MLLVEALITLLFFDLLNVVLPFERICFLVSNWRIARAPAFKNSDVATILTALNYACVWYPKRALCLQRSFVATRLLRRAGIAAKMAVGARTAPFKAHAWVEVDGKPVTERADALTAFAVWER